MQGYCFFAKSTEFLIIQATVVCALFKGTNKVYILDQKNFSGNILENIEEAILFVQRHTNVEYRIEKIRRENIPDIPETAIREAIINAVCHRDYFEGGVNVMVEVYENRVEIYNAGGLPSGLSAEEFGTKSVARNRVVASLLHRVHYIERMGTGIERIRKAIQQHGKGRVEFKYSKSSMFFIVIFYFEPVGKVSGKTSGKIIELISQNPNITISELAKHINITERSIERNIQKLQKENLLKRVGSAKGGHWEVLKF